MESRSRPTPTIWLGCAVVALAVLVAVPALGQPSAKARAYGLYVEGRKAFRAANYSRALENLARSFALDPRPTVAYDIALCHRALAQYRSSIASFQRYLKLRGATLRTWERKKVESLVSEMERKLCPLTVDAEPAGATVKVDGQGVGTAPLPGPVSVDPGRRVVEVTRDGFYPVSQTVEVADGQSLHVTIKLEQRVRFGVLVVISAAPGATVVIGGGSPQPLPLSERLPEGEYQLKVVAPNHLPQEQRVTVTSDDVTSVEVVLVPAAAPVLVAKVPVTAPVEQPPPVYRRAWFWVTLGAVAVAAGAAGGYLGYRSRSGDSFDRSLQLR